MEALLTAVAGVASSLIVGGIRQATTLLDKLPPFARSLVVLVVAQGVSLLNSVSGLALPTDPTSWTATGVNGLVIWLVAMGAHAVKKALAK